MENLNLLQRFLLAVSGISVGLIVALTLVSGKKDDDDFGGMA